MLDLKKYLLQSYFQDGILYVDFASAVHPHNHVYYDFGKNIIENNLEYRLKEDILIKVIGISMFDIGGKIEIEAGDPEGEVHTLQFYNIGKTSLQIIVNEEIGLLKVDGYRGDFTTFGRPVVRHGDRAVLNDDQYPERNGIYLVQQVKTTFGVNGYRHSPTLERKLVNLNT